MKKETHYIDNKKFHLALVERKQLVDSAKLNNDPLPHISPYIGECFLKLATNIAYKHNFNRYPYKEEMISDGIVDCIKYIDTFDVDRFNPFAYFTSAIGNAFVRRIVREKKEGYKKFKLLMKSSLDVHALQDQDEDSEFINAFVEYMQAFNNYDGSQFESIKKAKIPPLFKGATLEDFLVE